MSRPQSPFPILKPNDNELITLLSEIQSQLTELRHEVKILRFDQELLIKTGIKCDNMNSNSTSNTELPVKTFTFLPLFQDNMNHQRQLNMRIRSHQPCRFQTQSLNIN
jgi:hypothetical protein